MRNYIPNTEKWLLLQNNFEKKLINLKISDFAKKRITKTR